MILLLLSLLFYAKFSELARAWALVSRTVIQASLQQGCQLEGGGGGGTGEFFPGFHFVRGPKGAPGASYSI